LRISAQRCTATLARRTPQATHAATRGPCGTWVPWGPWAPWGGCGAHWAHGTHGAP